MTVWNKSPGLRSREELMRMLDEEGSINNVAKRVGCSRQTVSKTMRKYGIVKKGYIVGEEMRERLRLP